MHRFLLFLYLFMGGVAVTTAQVINDHIADRISLTINGVHYSSTVNCTVEWKCLNQKLTSSCIKYHNDQWFEIIPAGNIPYFINVSGQECRDIWGVQVVVLAGNPCEPADYELITCYSDGNKDDIFIRLPQLTSGQTYLVNVDGYLNDQCVFGIEFSDQPKGLPLESSEDASGKLTMDIKQALLEWEVTPELSNELIHYELWKNQGSGTLYDSLITIAHERNSFGEGKLTYSFQDIVYSSMAEYRIIGVTASDRILIAHVKGKVDEQLLEALPENTISLELLYAKGDDLAILLYHAGIDTVLHSYELTYDPAVNGWLRYNVRQFREKGIESFKIVVIKKKTWERQEYIFDKSALKEE
jgi:hypothetical protein